MILGLKPIAFGAVIALAAGVGVGAGWALSSGSSAPPASTPASAMAWIDAPSDGDVLDLGFHVVNSHAAAPQGVTTMFFSVNGFRQVNERPGGSIENVDWSFVADEPGEYVLTVWGELADGTLTTASTATVTVVEPLEVETSPSAEPEGPPPATGQPGTPPGGTPAQPEPQPQPEPEAEPEPGPACTTGVPLQTTPADDGIASPEYGDATAVLAWQAQGTCPVVGFRVELSTDSAFGSLWGSYGGDGSTTMTVVGPLACTTYYWRVRANYEGFASGWATRSFQVESCGEG